MWTVGLAVSGNEFGATWDAYQTMSKEDVAVRREHAASKLYAAGRITWWIHWRIYLG